MDVTSDFAHLVAEAARPLDEPRCLDDTWQTIVEVAGSAVPGFDHVGIATLKLPGEIETRAFAGYLVVPLDQVQSGLRQGPCSEVLQSSDAMSVSSLKEERRWPGYVPVAREWGVRSQMAVRLYLGKGTLGSLNFYSTICDEVSGDAQVIAREFAPYAAIALGLAREFETFSEGMQSRKVIAQATGILMHRYDINEERAFALLVRALPHTDVGLRAVAQGLIDEQTGG